MLHQKKRLQKIARLLEKTVIADKKVAHLYQIVSSLVAGLVLVFGILRLEKLDLTESQLFVGMASTLVLTGVFIVLGFQCRAWRGAA